MHSYAVIYGPESKESFRSSKDLTGKKIAILKGYNDTDECFSHNAMILQNYR